MPSIDDFPGLGDAPGLLEAETRSLRLIRLFFSEGMDPAQLLTGNFTLTANGGSTVRTITGLTRENTTYPTWVDLSVSGDLSLGAGAYTVTALPAVIDAAGNPMDPNFDEVDVDVFEAEVEIDHAEAGVRRLIAQYRGRPRIEAVIRLIGAAMNVVEQEIANVRSFRDLDTAYGIGLDRIGEILGLARGGLDDDIYRVRLRAKARAIGSKGRPENRLAVLEILRNAAAISIRLDEHAHASVVVEATPLTNFEAQGWMQVLRTPTPGGVQFILHHDQGEIGGGLFGWDEDEDALGWSEDSDDYTGGIWPEASA